MVRIDLSDGNVEEIEAPNLSAPIIVDEALYASGPEGMVRLADDGTTWTPIEAAAGCSWPTREARSGPGR